jgi:hypothetical protein
MYEQQVLKDLLDARVAVKARQGGLALEMLLHLRTTTMLKRMTLLALLTISLASAKTFKFSLAEMAKAGDVQLIAGDYRLEVNGSEVVLTDKDGRPAGVNARVEKADFEFSFTAVVLSRADGTTRIKWIYLENRKSRVAFE